MTKPQNLKALEDILEYSFKDKNLLITALTHRSCLADPKVTESYERLEFLGDAILEMLISDYLFKQYPDKKEGFLTSARSAVVRTESLSQISKEFQINQFILISKGEESSNGRENPSTLEDVIESIMGALFCDGGIEATTIFFNKFILPKAENISEDKLKDAKSTLQEKIQAKGLLSPIYQTISEKGPDHEKTFEVAVSINNIQIATGKGKSKQEAEQNSAQKALDLI